MEMTGNEVNPISGIRKEPDFVHNEIKFFKHEALTHWCTIKRHGKSLDNHIVFLTEGPDGWQEYLLVRYEGDLMEGGTPVKVSQSQEAIAVFIDLLKI